MLTSIKYRIFQGLAVLFALLTLIAIFLPAFFADSGEHYSLFALIFGNEKSSFQIGMLFGFIFLVIAILVDIAILVLSLLKSTPSCEE